MMSVDTLRETFHINRVSAERLEDFLTAQTYRPEITATKQQIRSLPHSTLQEVCKRPIRQGRSPAYAEGSGLVCVKPKNTTEMMVSIDDADFIDAASKKDVEGQRLEYGDIVITRSGAGTIGRASIFLSTDEVYTNDHLFIVRADAVDKHYACAFLNTYSGQRLLEAGISGSTGQLNLSNEHVKNLPLYTPDPRVQTYIGDKIRQAKSLSSWAAEVQAAAALEMRTYKKGIKPYFGKSFRVQPTELTAARLDSQFFHPDHLLLQLQMRSSGCIPLGRVATLSKGGWNRGQHGTFLYYEIGGLNVGTGAMVPTETEISNAPSRATTAVRQGDVLVSTVRPNRRNVGIIIENASDKPMVATSGFSVLRFESLEDAAFYHSWLRTSDATSQLMRWNSGSTYPAIDEEVPLSLLVPNFDVAQRAETGRRLLNAQFAIWFSSKLSIAAKYLLEALIAGRVDEKSILDAQSALNLGDHLPDREMMSRLKGDGFDGRSENLVSDLDRLYDLISQAEQA